MNTYPEMNAKIKDLLRLCSTPETNPVEHYAAQYIEELEAAVVVKDGALKGLADRDLWYEDNFVPEHIDNDPFARSPYVEGYTSCLRRDKRIAKDALSSNGSDLLAVVRAARELQEGAHFTERSMGDRITVKARKWHELKEALEKIGGVE